MIIKLNHSLAKLNTFGIDQRAERLLWAQSADEILAYIKHHGSPALVLGGGSNMLLTKDIKGDVLLVDIQGRTVIQEDDAAVWVEFGAGENWHETVLWTLEQGWAGLENLSLIPGNCGTAPVQNIGAYGVELKDVFVSCRGVHCERKEYFEINAEQAQFGYRDSLFKKAWKNKAIITHITLKLSKQNHTIHGNYGSLKAKLDEMGLDNPTPQDISRAVIAIRSSKLPDPKVLGNSGSFFKNPVVPQHQADALKEKHPDMPTFANEHGVKIAAGWLIEEAGWKGHRVGDAGVHEHQALVLVNHGKATGAEILALSREITESVYNTFGITLHPEVNLL